MPAAKIRAGLISTFKAALPARQPRLQSRTHALGETPLARSVLAERLAIQEKK